MNSLIDPLKTGAIALRGAHQLTLSGIHWVGEPSDEEFADARAKYLVMSRVLRWLQGDLVLEWVRRQSAARPGITVKNLVVEFAQAEGGQVDACYEAFLVAQAFPWLERSNKLTWSHYRLVWAATESRRERKEWLKQAEAGAWTCERLRAEMAAVRKAADPDSGPVLPGIFPLQLQNAVDWAASRIDDVEQLTPEQAGAQLSALAPIIEYANALSNRANKESIKPAA